jgi:hypothetical protein
MSVGSGTKSVDTIDAIDKLIESDDLSTRSGLKLAFSALRDALSLMSDISNQNSTMEKKVNVMWSGFQVGLWVGSAFGLSVIALIWSLITGAATITFGR